MAFEKPTLAELQNRFTYHEPLMEQTSRYKKIRTILLDAATKCVELTPCSPEQTRAVNALEDAMFLFNAAIARREPAE